MVVNPFRSSQIANHWDLGMVLNLELVKTKTWASKHSSIRENHGNSVRACQVTSVVSDSATPWTVAHQAPLSMGFSRQDYWGGLPCLPPGDLPYLETESKSPALRAGSLPLGKPNSWCIKPYFVPRM